MTELLNAQDVQAWLDGGSGGPVVIQGVDLRPFARPLVRADLKGSSLLGCDVDPVTQQQADKQGGVILPEAHALPDPLRCFPTSLYDAAFLYRGFDPSKGGSWVGTPDNLG